MIYSPLLRVALDVQALAVFLTLVSLSQVAAEPVFEIPPGPVPIGGFCDVAIRGLEDPTKLAWTAVPDTTVRVTAVWGTTDPILSIPSNQAGTWHLVVSYLVDGKPVLKKIPLQIGGVGPGPEPGPTPPPGPNPPPTPTPVGPRTILLLHESTAGGPEFGQLTTLLRQPPHSDYLKGKKHKLSILDVDSVGPDGRPSPAVESWRPFFAGMDLPVLIIYDTQNKHLIHKQSISKTAIAADVIDIIKEHE